jgi:hypothetical protein
MLQQLFTIFVLFFASSFYGSASFADTNALLCTEEISDLMHAELSKIKETVLKDSQVKVEYISLYKTSSGTYERSGVSFSFKATLTDTPSDIVISKQMFYSKEQGCFTTDDLE